MDMQTKFLYNRENAIYAIRRVVNTNGDVIDGMADIDVVAHAVQPEDASGIVRQLSFRGDLCEASEKWNKQLTAQLLKAQRTNGKLRREIRKLKKAKK